MTQDQVLLLLKLLEKIADRQFTITQATDWPLIVVFASIMVSMVVFFRQDLKRQFDDIKEIIKTTKNEDEKQHDLIWAEIRSCQEECCPRWLKFQQAIKAKEG